VTADIAYQER
jgi:hypothetical protein